MVWVSNIISFPKTLSSRMVNFPLNANAMQAANQFGYAKITESRQKGSLAARKRDAPIEDPHPLRHPHCSAR